MYIHIFMKPLIHQDIAKNLQKQYNEQCTRNINAIHSNLKSNRKLLQCNCEYFRWVNSLFKAFKNSNVILHCVTVMFLFSIIRVQKQFKCNSLKVSAPFWEKLEFLRQYVLTSKDIHNWPLQPFSQDYWPSFSRHLYCMC